MRASLATLTAVLLVSAVAGCTPYIPVKNGFGTSALAAVGSIPPEFAASNNYNPGVNRLLAGQLCATPALPLEEKSLAAAPGRLLAARSRCQTHIPLFGP